jgi:hypothetical protein
MTPIRDQHIKPAKLISPPKKNIEILPLLTQKSSEQTMTSSSQNIFLRTIDNQINSFSLFVL